MEAHPGVLESKTLGKRASVVFHASMPGIGLSSRSPVPNNRFVVERNVETRQ